MLIPSSIIYTIVVFRWPCFMLIEFFFDFYHFIFCIQIILLLYYIIVSCFLLLQWFLTFSMSSSALLILILCYLLLFMAIKPVHAFLSLALSSSFFLIVFFLQDYTTYILHRMYHTPFLYKHFHKLHHKYTYPTAFSVTAIHPVEILHIQLTMCLPLFTVPVHWCKLLYLPHSVPVQIVPRAHTWHDELLSHLPMWRYLNEDICPQYHSTPWLSTHTTTASSITPESTSGHCGGSRGSRTQSSMINITSSSTATLDLIWLCGTR